MSAAAGGCGDRGGRAGGAGPGVRAGRRRPRRGAAGGEAGGPAGPGLPGGGRVESGDVAAGAGDRAPADPVGRQPPVAGGSRPAGIARPGDPRRQMRGDGVPSGTTGPPRARRNPLRPARAPVEAAVLADPRLEGRRWNERAEPVPVTGQVNLRGLEPLAVVEVLYGLQQRVRAGCTSYCRIVRSLAAELRQAQAPSLADLPAQEEKGRQGLLNSLTMHAGLRVRRPAVRDRQGQVGPDRPGPSRLALLHRHQPAMAARVGQGMGRSRPATAAGQAGGRPPARDRRRGDPAVGDPARREGRPGRRSRCPRPC